MIRKIMRKRYKRVTVRKRLKTEESKRRLEKKQCSF